MKRRRWFRLPVTDRTLSERDVAEELDTHVAERVERLMAAGLSEQDARAEAERRLGGVARARYALVREAWDRDVRLSLRDRIRSITDDLRYAVRAVSRERGYALVVVITLALGIGANATMFGLLDRLLLSGPAHVIEADELYRFYANTRPPHSGELNTFAQLNGVVFDALRERVTSMDHVAAYMTRTLTLRAGPDARQLDAVGVTSSFFDLTGVRPALGRFITPAEDDAAGERVVVLGHALWQSEYGGRADALGEVLQLSGTGYRVIGVAPRGFTGVEFAHVDAWVQIAPLAGDERWTSDWIGFFMPIVARLRDGASLDRAAAEATAAWRAATDGRPGGMSEGYMTLAGIRADASGAERMEARVARWLMAVAAIVLLVACANVANLYFARGLRRRREIAVRLALGISRARLIRLLLAESMLLAVLGGGVALIVAYWGADIVRTVLLPQVDWTTSPLNVRVLGVAAAVTAFVGIATGLAPALMASSTKLAPSLAGSVHVPPAPGRARDVLAVLQAAFCVVLLAGAGVFVRSLWSVHSVDLGLDPDRVLAASFEWQTPPDLSDEERAALTERRRVFYREAAERIAAEPGVEHASVAIGAAFRAAFFAGIRADGVDSIPSQPGGGPYMSAVTSDYFATLGTAVLRGRAFLPSEGAGTDPVAILSRTTAEALWPAADPIGRCIFIGQGGPSPDAPCSRVVGVVADTRRFRITEDAALQIYVPLGQQPDWMGAFTVLARVGVRPATMVEPLRRVLYDMEPALRFVNVQPFTEYLEPQRRPWKLGAVLFALCGALALSIAVVGLYGVIAYLVVHRRHEIGVRMALGAERGDVVRMVLRQALMLAGIGVLIGVGVALVAAPYLEPLLFETPARDGIVLGATAAILAAAAIVAGTVPAWRASHVTPTEALREG
jgi:predicted permease